MQVDLQPSVKKDPTSSPRLGDIELNGLPGNNESAEIL